MKRVAINYSDGEYHMYDPSSRKFADGVDPEQWLRDNTIEITDDEWHNYQRHCACAHYWYRRMRAIDGEIQSKTQHSPHRSPYHVS